MYPLFLLLLSLTCIDSHITLLPNHLRTHHQHGVAVIDTIHPELSFDVELHIQDDNNKYTYEMTHSRSITSYQIQVYQHDTSHIMWDIHIHNNITSGIIYAGKALKPHHMYTWHVRVWDESHVMGEWSIKATFMTGLLQQPWTGTWIGATSATGTDADYLRSTFTLPATTTTRHTHTHAHTSTPKRIFQALVSISGLGHFELRLNGAKVGDSVLENAWTHYNHTCLYVTYDVSHMLLVGAKNTFGVILGNGMYNVNPGNRYAKFVGTFGDRMMILEMTIHYTDGSVDVITSSDTWTVSKGPITFNSAYGGEDYDARIAQNITGWDTSTYDASGWEPTVDRSKTNVATNCVLSAHTAPRIRLQDQWSYTAVRQLSSTKWVYDMGLNVAGWPILSVSGTSGAAIRMTPAELINDDGTVDQESGGGGPTYYTYTLNGDSMETWHPRFNYYSFRYVQVECVTGPCPIIHNLETAFIYNSAPQVGTFISSDSIINRIHMMILQSMRSNMMSIFTDCPHREKLGWLETTHLLFTSLMYNYDIQSWFHKLMNDMKDSQRDDGMIASIAPQYTTFPGPDFNDSPEWGSAYPLVASYLYQYYGDISNLHQHYPTLSHYINYLTSRCNSHHILTYGLGDWCDIAYHPFNDNCFPKNTPQGVTGTCIWYADIIALRDAAKVLGLDVDVNKWNTLATLASSSFITNFYHNDTISFATNSQTSNSFPSAIGIVTDKTIQDAVVKHIVTDVISNNNHVTTGEVAHPYLLRVLAEHGHSDLINTIIHNTDTAGYAYMLAKGSTSLPEQWDATRAQSQNHAMLGHIEHWFYHDLVGIQIRNQHDIHIKPHIIHDLTYIHGTHRTIYGMITSEWKVMSDDSLIMSIEIPVNTMVTVHIPTASGTAHVSTSNDHNVDPKNTNHAYGVTFIEYDAKTSRQLYHVSSGKYSFHVTSANRSMLRA